MFINPKKAVDAGWITHPDANIDWDKYLQPNAIDFTLDRVFTISSKPFLISEQFKVMRGGEELAANMIYPSNLGIQQADQQMWTLQPHTVYDGMSNFHVSVPEGVVVVPLVVRSTFNRNGIFLTSGVYDSGFSGSIGMAIHNRGEIAYIAPGTRIGQVAFVESSNAGLYAGGYNTQQGEHWTERKGK